MQHPWITVRCLSGLARIHHKVSGIFRIVEQLSTRPRRTLHSSHGEAAMQPWKEQAKKRTIFFKKKLSARAGLVIHAGITKNFPQTGVPQGPRRREQRELTGLCVLAMAFSYEILASCVCSIRHTKGWKCRSGFSLFFWSAHTESTTMAWRGTLSWSQSSGVRQNAESTMTQQI